MKKVVVACPEEENRLLKAAIRSKCLGIKKQPNEPLLAFKRSHFFGDLTVQLHQRSESNNKHIYSNQTACFQCYPYFSVTGL